MRASDGVTCPYCGSDSGVEVRQRANGWIVRSLLWDGTVDETNLDGMRERTMRTAVCMDCGKRVRNPELQANPNDAADPESRHRNRPAALPSSPPAQDET